MATFYIPESNVSRLEKKLATIQKKCNKNQFNFVCEKTGEEIKDWTDEDGIPHSIKYFIYEVEGTVKHEGWEFAATIDHHEAGNVIRAFKKDLVIPEKYKTCGPTCEHCNKIRSRKDTYLIYNEENNEFKQVGRNCMQEYTNGLDAESVAFLVSIYEEMENGFGGPGSGYTSYIEVPVLLRYAFETYRHFGYVKKYKFNEGSWSDEFNPDNTATRTVNFMHASSIFANRYFGSKELEAIRELIAEVGYDPDSDYAKETSEAAIAWIKEQNTIGNDYLRNLQILCSEEYTEYRNIGIIVSLTATYGRYLEKEVQREAKEKAHKQELVSEYQGEVGSKLSVDVNTCTCISSWENMYGVTNLYKFTDADGNIYIWYASKYINDADKVTSVSGTVKDHSEFNNVKQTVLTRCKVAY